MNPVYERYLQQFSDCLKLIGDTDENMDTECVSRPAILGGDDVERYGQEGRERGGNER